MLESLQRELNDATLFAPGLPRVAHIYVTDTMRSLLAATHAI